MAIISPKIEIINHFDNLINDIDIDIEQSIEKYKDEQILSEILLITENDRRSYEKEYSNLNVEFHENAYISNNRFQTVDLWPETTKVIDYLNQVRMKTINELRKAQEDALEYYKLYSSRFKSEEKNFFDQQQRQLFADGNSYFQIHCTKKRWTFDVFTFETDFYMSPSEINLLDKFINTEKEPFAPFSSPVFDEKMVLICLLYKSFLQNLFNFPSHVIRVRKEDVTNIKTIKYQHHYSGVNLTAASSIDLSRLVNLHIVGGEGQEHIDRKEINIEGLSSLKQLHLVVDSNEAYFSIRKLFSLKAFKLCISCDVTLDENITELLDGLQSVEKLILRGKFAHFSLDNLVSLKHLRLYDILTDNINIELLKNLCVQLEELELCFNLNNESTLKLLNDLNFPCLKLLSISKSNIRKVTKKFIDQFPMLRELYINHCNLETIEDNAFSNLKHLVRLDLNTNFFVTLKKQYFPQLINLEYLILKYNRIEYIEKNVFSNLKNLKIIDLRNNKLSVLDRESFIGFPYLLKVFVHGNDLDFSNPFGALNQ